MSQTFVPWILGGWFVVSACVGLVMGRISSAEPLADASDTLGTPASAEDSLDQVVRPKMAA